MKPPPCSMATCNCAWRHSATLELEWDGSLALGIDHVTIAAAVATIINASNAMPMRFLVVTLATLDPQSEVLLFRSWCARCNSGGEALRRPLEATRRAAKRISRASRIKAGGPTQQEMQPRTNDSSYPTPDRC